MTALILMVLFGLTMIAAMCNLPSWWRLWHRSNELKDELSSARFQLRGALFVANLTMSFVCWLRLSAIIQDANAPRAAVALVFPPLPWLPFRPVSFTLPDWLAIGWMVAFLFVELAYLSSGQRALRAMRRRSRAVYWFGVLSSLWLLDIFLWSIAR